MNEREWDEWYTTTRDRLLLRSSQLHKDAVEIFQKASRLGPVEEAETKAFASIMNNDADLISVVQDFLEKTSGCCKKIYSLDEQMGDVVLSLKGIQKWMHDWEPTLNEAQKDYGEKLGKVTRLDKPPDR